MAGMEAAMEPPVSPASVSSGMPAPYGRACTNCARAKCRCIYRVAEASCERCHRLKKDCIPSQTVRKRNGRRRIGYRTAQLEEKLEDLVSLLRKHNPGSASVPETHANSNPSTTARGQNRTPLDPWVNTPAPSLGSQTDALTGRNSDDRRDSNPSDANSDVRPLPSGPRDAGSIFASTFDPNFFRHRPTDPVPVSSMINCPEAPATREEADELLLLFRERYLECFPCIYIPPDVTSSQLREEKPFVWFSIMMVASQTTALQFAMCAIWQKILGQKIVIEHDKQIDYVQGIVIFLGWSQYHKKDKPYLSIFTQLALAQVYDLTLNKVYGDPSHFSCFKPYHSIYRLKERTMEDRRTVLSCFYITSQISYTLKKMEGLRWTSHMADCLATLSERPEWEGDQVLAAQVRIQLIVDQVAESGYTPASKLPSYYVPSALMLPVETIKRELPPGLENNNLVRIQLVYTEIVVLENALSRTPYVPNEPDLRRYEILGKTASAIKIWFASFWPISRNYYSALSFASWCQLAHCLMSLYKLSVLDEPAWDRVALRRDLDVFDVSDRIIQDMADAGTARRLSTTGRGAGSRSNVAAEDDIFSTCTKLLTAMRNSWATEMGMAVRSEPNGTSYEPIATEFVDAVTSGPMAMPMNLADDAWLTDIFNVSWE